jgi:hypothetical protein
MDMKLSAKAITNGLELLLILTLAMAMVPKQPWKKLMEGLSY